MLALFGVPIESSKVTVFLKKKWPLDGLPGKDEPDYQTKGKIKNKNSRKATK